MKQKNASAPNQNQKPMLQLVTVVPLNAILPLDLATIMTIVLKVKTVPLVPAMFLLVTAPTVTLPALAMMSDLLKLESQNTLIYQK